MAPGGPADLSPRPVTRWAGGDSSSGRHCPCQRKHNSESGAVGQYRKAASELGFDLHCVEQLGGEGVERGFHGFGQKLKFPTMMTCSAAFEEGFLRFKRKLFFVIY